MVHTSSHSRRLAGSPAARMSAYQWANISDQHPGAHMAEGADVGECRVTVVWTLHPGIKQHHQVRAMLTRQGGSLWMVEKKFERYHSAFNFFRRMREQAEIRLAKLT